MPNKQRSVIIKAYKGSQASAIRKFQNDAKKMAEKNYFPTSQSYAPGSYGVADFVGAIILCFLIIGIIIFIYMLVVKPQGVLSVTYEYRGFSFSGGPYEKTCPKCAETIKAAAQVCRYCSYQFDHESIMEAQAAIQKANLEKEAALRAVREKSLSHRLSKFDDNIRKTHRQGKSFIKEALIAWIEGIRSKYRARRIK